MIWKHCCEAMQHHLEKGEVAIRYFPKFREYGLPVLDGGSSRQRIHFCPWCGHRLPESLRDQWFERLDAMNLEPDSPDLPVEYETDAWWLAEEE